jgi:hypothetical protein
MRGPAWAAGPAGGFGASTGGWLGQAIDRETGLLWRAADGIGAAAGARAKTAWMKIAAGDQLVLLLARRTSSAGRRGSRGI